MIIKRKIIISYSMYCKQLTQPTNIQEKSSSCYHSMNVFTTLYKNNECLNPRLLCYLCFSLQTLFQILSTNNYFVDLPVYGGRWFKKYIFVLFLANWNNCFADIEGNLRYSAYFKLDFFTIIVCYIQNIIEFRLLVLISVELGYCYLNYFSKRIK